MTLWTPDWKILVNGSELTSVTLSNLTITSGRQDINSPTPPGYCSVEIINTVPSSSLPSGFTAGTPVISGGGSTGGGIGGGTIIAPVVTGTMPSFPSGLNPSGNAISSGFNVAGTVAANQRGNVIINVNAPSAIDEEGFTRAVVLALNNSNARNGGGGAILGGLVAE